MTTHNSQYSAETAHPDKQESSPAPTAAGTTASNVSTTGNATTPDASIALNADATPVADVPPRLFGSFVEHLGRCVYGGIYEPSHPTADENGFRQDVLDLVKELGVTCVRYPGGNFVSNYNWEDGIGPRENRPVRRDLAWHCTETNEMGIDDFYRWSQKAGTEIMLAVNMGTRGLKAALDELEYVNGAPGTAWADQRVANGIEEPMDIKMWCIGNEMDGPWQVGHMSPEEYAGAVDKVAHAMKLAESGLELVACGSSGAYMPTFGTWEKTVLTKAYENLDFVSCHAYYFDRGHKTRTAASMQDFLASSEDMTKFIATVSDAADQAREANNGTKDIALSFDEWGVWYSDKWNEQEDQWKAEAAQGLHHEPWPTFAGRHLHRGRRGGRRFPDDHPAQALRSRAFRLARPAGQRHRPHHGRGTRPGMAADHVLPVRRSRPSRARPGLRSGHQLPHHPYRGIRRRAGHRRGSHVG